MCFIMVYDHGQTSPSDFSHCLFAFVPIQRKNYYFCCIQRSVKSHICRQILCLSAHSFHIPNTCLLHWLYGTMPPSCSIMPCASGSWLATPQLVTSSTQSWGEVKKAVLHPRCHTQSSAAELDHRCPRVEVPPVTRPCAVGLPQPLRSCQLTALQKTQCSCGYWWFCRFCHSLYIPHLCILMTCSDHRSQGTELLFPLGR